MPFMSVGYYASESMIQDKRKWANIAAQHCAYIASREKDAKRYIEIAAWMLTAVMAAVKMVQRIPSCAQYRIHMQ